jgi:TIR domain
MGMANEIKIFISHSHVDKKIADVVRQHLNRWGFPNRTIFQSSEPGLGPQPGRRLTDEIQTALHQAKAVILLYTRADEDWSWCMFECGLATDPQKPDATRVIFFRCNEEEPLPGPFEGAVVVQVNENSIRDFTKRLLSEDDFLPGEAARYPMDDTPENILRDLSDALYRDLRDAISHAKAPKERYRWDRFSLRLETDENGLSSETNEDELCATMQRKLVVTHVFGEALRHFGYANLEDGLRLSDLVHRWREEISNRDNISQDWIKGLCLELQRAIKNAPADPTWDRLESAYYHKLYHLVVNHARIFPDNSMEFDIYLYDAH